MSSLLKTLTLSLMIASSLSAMPLRAQEVNLLDGVTTPAENNPSIEPGKYKKDAPWVIGMSSFGVNANTWTVQVAHEAEARRRAQEAGLDKWRML